MPDSRPLDTNQKIVLIGFPSLGGVLLAIGLYLVIIKDSQSSFVFGALGISMFLFLIASVAIGYRLFGPARSVRQPSSPETSPAEAKDAAPQLGRNAVVQLPPSDLKPDAVLH